MPNTFRQWRSGVIPIVLFYGLFLVIAVVSSTRGNPAILGWKISLGLSSIIAMVGVLGSWQVIAHTRGVHFFPALEYIGVWSLIVVEVTHALYFWPIALVSPFPAGPGRSFSHLALALAVYLVARRRLRWRNIP